MKLFDRLFSFAVLATLTASWGGGPTARADFPGAVLSQGPVGYWRLNENVQPRSPRPAADIGSLGAAGDGQYLFGPKRGEPGALSGGSATSVRFFNPDLDPTFGASKVDVPFNTVLNPNGPFSVEFWAKPNTLVNDVFCTVASINSDPAIGVGTNARPRAGWLFYQNGSGTNGAANQWQFRLGNAHDYLDSDSIVGGTVTTGAWHHIVGTFDGSKASLYVNGVKVAGGNINGFQANDARPFRIGTTCFDGALGPIGTYAGNRGFDGWLEEVAFYGPALSAEVVMAHFGAGKTSGAAYASSILADQPIGYWRLGEPGNPPAANLGSLGANANGQYIFPSQPGQAGPQPPDYPGLEGDNRGCGFDGSDGFVALPPLSLNTNRVTMTAWILANSIQPTDAGILFCRAGTTVAGLKFDASDPNGLSYTWNNDETASNFKSGLAVPVSQWCFVALIVQPEQAILCLQDGTQFSTAINNAAHPDQAFEGFTLIGTDIQDSTLTINGVIDEVAIFNRSLSVGEVYSEYGAAVGNLKPSIFTEVQAPSETVYEGDTLSLSVDAGGTPPLSYQWRKDGMPVSEAISNPFAKTNVITADSGNYDVVISNSEGSITNQQVTVTVQPISQPSVSESPQDRTLYTGGLLSVAVQATGGGLSYQWQKNGTNLIGATNASYSVANASGNDSGGYQAIVSNLVSTVLSAAANITVVVPRAGSYEDLIVRDSPESWWRLDDPTGTTRLADSMGRHDGVYQGGVTPAAAGALEGNPDTAASFDGSSGYAEVPFSKALNTPNFTIECWVKANPVAAALCPLGSFTQPPGRGFLLQKSADGIWYYMFGDGVDPAVFVLDGSDATYNGWTHLAITYDGIDYRGYFNGNLDALTSPFVAPNNVAPLRIGFDQPANGWNDFWNGDIDEVAYYQNALTADQIAAHVSIGRYGSPTKPVFTQQPQSSTSALGSQFFFAPVVEGSPPIQFQWSRNGVPIQSETNFFLLIPDASFGDTGIYELAASNAIGTTTSAPATLAVLPQPAFANATNGLVLHLNFDGTYRDSSGRTNDAQPIGSPTFVAGVVGEKALQFSTLVDASDPNNPVATAANFVTLGAPPDLQFGSNVNFSISYWARFTGTPGDLPFLCNALNAFGNAGYTFAPSYHLGGWSWSLGDAAAFDSISIYGPDGSINDGNWHHLVHTFDRSASGITYLDGNQVDSRSVVPAGDLDTGEPTVIGQDPSGAYPEANQVDIDDVGVWRRVLTPFEVYAINLVGRSGNSFDTYGPVTLVVTIDAGAIQLVWQAGTLLEASDLGGTWSPVIGASAPYHKVAPSSARRFYKVQL